METNPLLEQLRRTYAESELSLRQLSIQSEVPYASVHAAFTGKRDDISLRTTAKLCKVLGLELRPMKGAKRVRE